MNLAPLLLCGCLLSAEAPSPDALTAHLKAFSVLHVDFTQTRTLAALSRPLKSSGSMTLAREQGVLWQIRKPLALGFLIKPRGLQEVDADGRARPGTAKDAPMVAQMGRIFQALLQGRWSALDELFTLRAEGSPERWRIVLAPRPRTAAFIKAIQISGGPFIDKVQVEEPSGDRMDLVFERPRTAEPLTEVEARLFKGE